MKVRGEGVGVVIERGDLECKARQALCDIPQTPTFFATLVDRTTQHYQAYVSRVIDGRRNEATSDLIGDSFNFSFVHSLV